MQRWTGRVVLLAAALTAACASEATRRDGGCTPGAIQSCQCVDGADGVRTCDDEGQTYGDCDCRPVDARDGQEPDVTLVDGVSEATPDAPADLPDGRGTEPAAEVATESTPEPWAEPAVEVAVEPTVEVTVEPHVEVVEVVDVAPPDLCLPQCAGKACGPDGCGASCGACDAGFLCSAAGACEPDCTPVPASPCQVAFAVPVTSPLRQDYVWITGTFCDWATTVEGGAAPLALDLDLGQWTGLLTLPAGPFEYKYLVKWADGEQQWCVLAAAQAFDCSPAAANLAGQSACGTVDPCVER